MAVSLHNFGPYAVWPLESIPKRAIQLSPMVFWWSNDLDILLIEADLAAPWCWAVGILHESLNWPSRKLTWSPGTYHCDCGTLSLCIETAYDASDNNGVAIGRTASNGLYYCPRKGHRAGIIGTWYTAMIAILYSHHSFVLRAEDDSCQSLDPY